MTDPKKARCFDKSWKYTPSNETDLHALFKRIRRQLKEQAAKPAPNVKPLTSAKTKPGGKT